MQARKIIAKVFRWQPAPGVSHQGFLKMLAQWQPELLGAIVPHLREQMQDVHPSRGRRPGTRCLPAMAAGWRWHGASPWKRPLRRSAGGGGRRARKQSAGRRRTAKHQAAAARQKKATSPQLWLTLFWHVGSGLPWAWRTGPSGASERDHLVAMVPELPAHALLVADAGFVGYELWQTLLAAGHHFVIRVGANVRLLRQLGWTREHAQVVYLWPDQAARKHQPPLVLRLVVVHDGKQPVYLVTDLPKTRLSDHQVATIYGARWGVEVFFRTFKQTFGCRKLRSRSASECPVGAGVVAHRLMGRLSARQTGAERERARARPLKPRGGPPRVPTHAAGVSRAARHPCGDVVGPTRAAPGWMTTRGARRKRVAPTRAKNNALPSASRTLRGPLSTK